MGAGTLIVRRRLLAALVISGLVLGLTGCGASPGSLPPIVETPDPSPVRIAILYDTASFAAAGPVSGPIGRGVITKSLTSGIVPFLTEERPGVVPHQSILAALRVKGASSNAEGAVIYADMRVRRGPGDIVSGYASPVRIQLLRRHGRLVVIQVERPGDGAANDHDMRLFPDWIRPYLDADGDPLLVAAIERLERERARAARKSTPPYTASAGPTDGEVKP